jgi:hypothetical protein
MEKDMFVNSVLSACKLELPVGILASSTTILRRMVSSWMLRHVTLVRTDPEDTILHSHRHENLKLTTVLRFVCSFLSLLVNTGIMF